MLYDEIDQDNGAKVGFIHEIQQVKVTLIVVGDKLTGVSGGGAMGSITLRGPAAMIEA